MEKFLLIKIDWGTYLKIPLSYVGLLEHLAVVHDKDGQYVAKEEKLEISIVDEDLFDGTEALSKTKKELEQYQGWYRTERDRAAKLEKELNLAKGVSVVP